MKRSNPDEVMAQIGNMIRDGIKPDLAAYTSIEAMNEDGVKVIRVSVLRGVKRPYHLTDKGLKPSGVFVRHGVSSVPATDEAIRQMLRESDGISRKDVESNLSVPKHIAVKLLNELLEERKIQKFGKAKAVRYFIRKTR